MIKCFRRPLKFIIYIYYWDSSSIWAASWVLAGANRLPWLSNRRPPAMISLTSRIKIGWGILRLWKASRAQSSGPSWTFSLPRSISRRALPSSSPKDGTLSQKPMNHYGILSPVVVRSARTIPSSGQRRSFWTRKRYLLTSATVARVLKMRLTIHINMNSSQHSDYSKKAAWTRPCQALSSNNNDQTRNCLRTMMWLSYISIQLIFFSVWA